MSFVKNLDTPLLRLSERDVFTARDACGGVHIFGGIGQGKTTGSGKMLAGALLRAGAGALISCVKPEDVPMWSVDYPRQHGRLPSVRVFDENAGYNFLASELSRHGIEGIGTVTECIMRIVEAAKQASSTGGQQASDAFWFDSARMLIRYTIQPLYAALGASVTVGDIIRFISSAPRDLKEVTDKAWQERSYMYSVVDTAASRPVVAIQRERSKIPSIIGRNAGLLCRTRLVKTLW